MHTFEHPVTPAVLSASLLALCEEIVPCGSPTYVDVRPVPGAPSNECFPIVEDRVRTHGGAMVLGWALREQPSLFIEAEFHAVWRSPSDGLLDIAPKKRPTQRILFLPDPARRYEGRQVNNVRKSLTKSPAVIGFLKTFDQEFELMNRGAREHQHGKIALEVDEAQELKRIQKVRTAHSVEIMKLHRVVGPYDPCWCGSGKKVKWCHGVGNAV